MYIDNWQQRIVEEAVKIASSLDEEYLAEARKIRLPYRPFLPPAFLSLSELTQHPVTGTGPLTQTSQLLPASQ